MRLKQIKLAGFKSFVDPTILHLDNNLIGVVGPNGCGKSNIIDAVKWVLGESSAKDLRGESMLDVIFNGSSIRKPISLASVELLFDNLEGQLNREYANFAEVSIRREVDRERQSEYYLNDKKCRKRDITDLFAGTGLLHNGYAIIGQGTVSQIIESKPEDLRSFIEEAADISIYKKRRHETELRIGHTEENLSRVKDIILEQTRLLEKLEKQSIVAKKYQEYSKQKQQLETKLLTIKAYKFNQDLLNYTKEIQEISLDLEKKSSNRTNNNLTLEQQKLIHHEKLDIYSTIKEQYYNLNTEIAKLEQTLKYTQEQQIKFQQDLLLVNQELAKINEQYLKDQQLKEEITKNLILVEHNYATIIEKKTNAEQEYSTAQHDLDIVQKKSNNLQLKLQENQSKINQHKISLDQIENLSKELCVRIEKLHHESNNYDQNSLLTEILLLEKKLHLEETAAQAKHQELLNINNKIQTKKLTIKNLLENKNNLQSNLHKLQGAIGSLHTLQQAALELNSAKLDWLSKNNIDPELLFFNQLNIEDGLEIPVAIVLNQYLDAILLDKTISEIEMETWHSVKDFRLAIVEQKLLSNLDDNYESNQMPSKDLENQVSIASKIQNSCLKNLFKHVYLIKNLEEGLKHRHQLLAHEFFVTKNGELLGANWLIIDKIDNKQKILLRNKELKHLQENLQTVEQELATINLNIDLEENFLIDIEKIQSEIINYNKQQEQIIRETISDLSCKKSKLDGIKHRITKITEETKEYHNKLNDFASKEQNLRANLSNEIHEISSLSTQEQELSTQKLYLQENLQPLLETNKLAAKEFHEISLKRQQLITTNHGLEEATDRLLHQIKILEEKRCKLQTELNLNNSSLQPLELQLEASLNDKVTLETNLQTAKNKLQEVEFAIQELENSQENLNAIIEQLRANLEKLKIEQQAISVRIDDLAETLQNNYAINLKEILQDPSLVVEEHQLDLWQEKLDTINKSINKLGMINLAAIEEFNLESERKNYLDLQLQDLTTALETLRNAIAKIDLETRKKFKITFDEININFQQLFPTLFGGGGAYLELTSNDLLSTGVNVFAHPPGKKNSSIYLLSGGEKALTAVALIFSIFKLNPAPFCILDEVDAPLDEANVIRYGDLLVSMSSKIQLIFITHNKTTMKIANQLIGVTMKEPGVSRLVSVNVDEAVALID